MKPPRHLVAAYAELDPIAVTVARQLWRKLPPMVELDDLIAEARAGLWKMVMTHDGLPLSDLRNLAWLRARGAIMDALRRTALVGNRRTGYGHVVWFDAIEAPMELVAPQLRYTPDPSRRLAVTRAFKRASFTERERLVLTETALGRSQAAIAKALGVTAPRVCQLYKAGMARLEAAL